MSKEFILTTDELFGSYCYIEQKRYGVPNEKFLYKIIGKFTSNAWSNVPVDANDKEPHIFNHSEEVVNVVCCGVCEDKIERYKLSDVEIISNKDQQLADLEAKLAESEDCNNMLYKCLTEKDIEIETKKEENAELQKQLAEKEEEIAYITKQVKKFNNEAQKYFEDAYCNDFHNQDKISFAVEVLKIAQDYVQQYVNNFDDMNDCLCAIDNQIKRLTHQHKDKGE